MDSNGFKELGCGRNVYFRGRWMPTKVDLTGVMYFMS
jgi:hypothetical protein